MCVESIEHHVGEEPKAVENLSGEDWMQSRKRPVAVSHNEPTGVALKSLRSQACFFEASMVPFVQTTDVPSDEFIPARLGLLRRLVVQVFDAVSFDVL